LAAGIRFFESVTCSSGGSSHCSKVAGDISTTTNFLMLTRCRDTKPRPLEKSTAWGRFYESVLAKIYKQNLKIGEMYICMLFILLTLRVESLKQILVSITAKNFLVVIFV
jgi:hypothetical protein